MRCFTTMTAAVAIAVAAFATDIPEGEFRTPFKANRPETFFLFIGGNVAKPGITADLEAIKGAMNTFFLPMPGIIPYSLPKK